MPVIPEYLDSKQAVVHLRKGDSFSYWFRADRGKILIIDYIPVNWPALVISFFEDAEEAKARLREMSEEEGWEIVKNALR